jgi:hypothetical protein
MIGAAYQVKGSWNALKSVGRVAAARLVVGSPELRAPFRPAA